MTVKELIGILNEAVERGCENMPVTAIINPDATTEIDDVAYGDVYLAYPFSDGKVFAITAIKGGFPEAIMARERAIQASK
jgi:hypothetical protein